MFVLIETTHGTMAVREENVMELWETEEGTHIRLVQAPDEPGWVVSPWSVKRITTLLNDAIQENDHPSTFPSFSEIEASLRSDRKRGQE